MRSNSILKIATIIMFVAYITALNYGGCGGGGGSSGSSGSSATVANRPPVLNPIGNQTIAEGATLTLTITATDPDGDTLTYSASSLPLGATFDATTHIFSWTLAYNKAGTYTGIRFKVTDTSYFAAEETITITVTDVPVPNTPSDLAANAFSTSQIDLTWTDNSTDEAGFKIERAPASGGQAGTYNQIDTVSASITSYSDTGLTEATAYYYRVCADNSAGSSAWSNEANATTLINPPAQVASPAPANSVTNVPINTQLSWASASGATSYDVYFGTVNPPPISQTSITITSYNPGVLAFSATYYWRIDSKNAGGTITGTIWSFSTKPPTPPAQVTTPTPTNSAANVSITTQLAWASAVDTASYDVYFGTSNPPAYITNTATTTYNPGALAFITTYYWRMDSKNSAGTTIGQVWSFTTRAPVPPAQATSPNPADGAINALITTTLTWATATDATSYDVYFGTTTTAWTPITNTILTSFSPLALQYSTTYYWRIDSKNTGGTTQGAVWTFTTQIAPPVQVTSPNPADSATGVITTTILAWADAARAASYDVYFDTANPPALAQTSVAITTYNPGALSYNTIYYWRIDSKNTTATTTGVTWSFTTQIAPPA
ncbi:MAG: putative Ig domain-containing protein [Planctomycetota bacterium]